MTPSKMVDYRSVMTIQGKNHYSCEMFHAPPDGKEFKAMEIQYTRARSGESAGPS